MRPAGARQLRQRAIGVLAIRKRSILAQRPETAQKLVKKNVAELRLGAPFRELLRRGSDVTRLEPKSES